MSSSFDRPDGIPAPETGGDAPVPAVSVLLATHNGARYIEEAIASIRAQTLRDIEILVIDDASSDETPGILARLAAEEPRMRVIRTPENLRLAGALNFGLGHVRAPYVARMDDDDIALPERLEVEKRFLDAHPGITLVGTSIDWIDGEGHVLRRTVRSRDSFANRWQVRFALALSHPTFMFRPVLPDGSPLRYDPACRVSQDHELVCRLLLAGGEVACLPDVLLKYRTHPASVSSRRLNEQMAVARDFCVPYQRAELPAPVVEALAPLRELYFDFAPATPDRVAGAFAGARAMLAHDVAAHPDRARWLRRQTGQLLAWSLRRGGASGREVALAFLRHAPGLMPDLGLRALETKKWLPTALHSDPDVWAGARPAGS